MSRLSLYPIPYSAREPPPGFFRGIETASEHSDANTTTFKAALDARDVFLGQRRCVVCGAPNNLRRTHIIGRADNATWRFLRKLGWAPEGVNESPAREPRNGLTLCELHDGLFNRWVFFIRFQPSSQKYIFVNYDSWDSTSPGSLEFHGKAIALDINHPHAPLPLLLFNHEYMVRGINFIQPTADVEITNRWQTWLVEDGVVDERDDGTFSFNREAPVIEPSSAAAGPSGSQTVVIPPTADSIEELLASQCSMSGGTMGGEGMRMAEDYVKKYVYVDSVESTE